MSKRDDLDAAILCSVLTYDRVSGEFTWLPRREESKHDKAFNTLHAGNRAGTVCPRGYRKIGVLGRQFREHHLAWLYVQGVWPEHDVDHINTNKSDNRWVNLRRVDGTENNANAHARQCNKVGLKGVSVCSTTGRYRASITCRGKFYHLGRFQTPEEAHQAYASAAKIHFGEFARFS